MSIMDLKSKGKSWVGNIYQKFETIGKDMDDMVSQGQDKVKFVENKVQIMGESVKKFYSDVFHGLFIPLVDPVEQEAQVLAQEGNATVDAYINSMVGIENNPCDIISKQPCTEPGESPLNNQVDHVLCGHDLLNQFGSPTSIDPPKGVDSDLVLEAIKDVTNENSVENVEENANIDESVEENAHVDESVGENADPDESVGENINVDESVGENTNVDESMGENANVDESVEENAIVDESVEENADIKENMEGNAMRENSSESEVSELLAAVKEGSLVASLLNELIDCNQKNSCHFLTEMPTISVHDRKSKSSGTVKNLCHDDGRSEDSIVFCQEKVAEVGSDSSGSSLSTQSSCVIKNSPESFSTKAVCHDNSVCVAGSVSDNSSVLSSFTLTPPNESNVAQMVPSRSVLAVDSIGAPNDTSSTDADYFKLETIELRDKVKLEDNHIGVDESLLYAVSCRTRNGRSFKEKIRHVFASKKSLVKEYEQLAIWFGDVDMSGEVRPQNLLPSEDTKLLEPMDSNVQHISDSEWELL